MPILDHEGRLVAILASCPNDDLWPDLSRQAAEMLEEACGRCKISAKAGHHRRGDFSALRCGVSHGGGQTAPGNLQNDFLNNEVLVQRNQKLPFIRLLGFATSKYCPHWHAFFSDRLPCRCISPLGIRPPHILCQHPRCLAHPH